MHRFQEVPDLSQLVWPVTDDERFFRLRETYGDLARETFAAVGQNGISCPSGCALCCTRPSASVETSVLEMMPVALAALRNGIGAHLLERAEDAGDENACVFYREQRREGESGCSVYEMRGLTCRLFGYSRLYRQGREAVRDFYACAILRDQVREAVSGAGVRRGSGAPRVASPTPSVLKNLPSAVRYRSAVTEIDPSHGTALYGINDALARAIRILGLPFFYGTGERRRRLKRSA